MEVKEERLILKGTRHKTFKTSKEEYIKTERVVRRVLPRDPVAGRCDCRGGNGSLRERRPRNPASGASTARADDPPGQRRGEAGPGGADGAF